MDADAPPVPLAVASGSENMAFARLAFRKSTAAQAIEAEDNPINPWTEAPRERTQEYFACLEKRRALPVAKTREDFINMYKEQQVIVYVGETGSGKTTQIPQYVMYADLPTCGGKRIVCTQPRRIAAREVSKRVAHELDVTLGEQVGYAFRNEAEIGPLTRVIYTTDGRLVQEIGSDPDLNRYSCIIVDEAHERSDTIDLLLGLLKPILQRRRDLKLIIMSATMRVETFRKYFGNCAAFTSTGRTYGYELVYVTPGDGLRTCVDYLVSAVMIVKHILINRVGEDLHSNTGGMGDILIFVPGEEDIKRAIAGILCEFPHHAVVGLHGSMSKEKQEQALAPVAGVKIIVATNIAETSLTIDGVVHVIDTGLTKGMTYNPRLNLWTLAVEPISQAAADQRAGRCGRTRPGFCWRLYDEEAYNKLLIKDPLPQLLRGDMMGMVLDIVVLGRNASATNLRDFPFIDKPAMETTIRAWYTLQRLGCLDVDGQITIRGYLARRLPLHPRHAMTVIRAKDGNPAPVWEVMAIMSLLNEDGIFIRPGHLASYADIIREAWSDANGDHFTLLNVWHGFQRQLKACEGKTEEDRDRHIARWCDVGYLNRAKLLGAQATFDSICRWLRKEHKYTPAPASAAMRASPEYAVVIKKILLQTGFLQIAVKDPQNTGNLLTNQTYRTLEEDQPVLVHPASVISRGYKHAFIFYDKFIDQGRPYLMEATGFDPDWLFEDPLIAPWIEKLLGSERLPRSERFVSLNRLELARSQYQKYTSSKET